MLILQKMLPIKKRSTRLGARWGCIAQFLNPFGLFIALAFQVGCRYPGYQVELPESSQLGTMGSRRAARVITHLHSPYSEDACDNNGLSGETPNAECLANLRKALCLNRIDFAFLTDHINHMKSYTLKQLILAQEGDTLTSKNGEEVLNKLGGCSNAHQPIVMAGFESRVIALGLTKHLATTPAERDALYSTETSTLRAQLQSQAEAVVVIPHTESRTLETIRLIGPDALEIYNIHANLDPKIRKRYLNEGAFNPLSGLLSYLIDPYGDLIADYSFLDFIKVHSLYFEKWNTLMAEGTRLTALAGNDGHENLLPNKLSDGERLDSFRRILRLVTNHVYVTAVSEAEIKEGIKKGRVSVVFEGLGSPANLSFKAQRKGDSTETAWIGDSLALNAQKALLSATAPTLHSGSSQGKLPPSIRMELRRINSDASETLVGQTSESTLEVETDSTGNYRLDVFIKPRHLAEFLAQFAKLAEEEYRWIITNPITLR